jgi:hypothetical protein
MKREVSLVRRLELTNGINPKYVGFYFKRSRTKCRIDIGCVGPYMIRYRLPMKSIAQLPINSERKVREIR